MKSIKIFFTRFIPYQWHKFTNWWKQGNLIYRLTIFVLVFIVGPITVYKTYLAYQQAEQQRAAKTEKIKLHHEAIKQDKIIKHQSKADKAIVTAGPRKYLRISLMANTDQQVIQMFNNNAKYHGKYEDVVKHAAKLGDINSFRDYLNPIINEIENGETRKAASLKHEFTITKNPNVITPSLMQSGVMIIGWNSNAADAQQQADKIDDIIDNAKNYKCFVFDTSTEQGRSNFSYQLGMYLNQGDKIRDGYNDTNGWTGIIYGFNNGLFVYHNTSLNNVPKKMPIASLANSNIENDGMWLNNER